MAGATAAVQQPPGIVRPLVAMSIGSALEWFDVAVYAYFASYISGAFGGFGPVVMLRIRDGFGTSIAPAWYLSFVAVLSLAALVGARADPQHRG